MTRPQHQSQIAKHAAQLAIDRKLAVMRDWVSQGIPYLECENTGHTLLDARDRKALEFFPTSLRQFKLWDGSQNSKLLRAKLPPLTTTGNDTLAKRKASVDQATRLIEALKLRAQSQIDEGRHSKVRRLEQELLLERKTVALRIAELRDQQRTIRRLERSLAQQAAQHTGHFEELKRLLKQAEWALANERQRNAELTVLVKKVRPIRRGANGE